jgi:hypothetical protein
LYHKGIDPSDVRKAAKQECIQHQINDERINNGLSVIDSFKYVGDGYLQT